MPLIERWLARGLPAGFVRQLSEFLVFGVKQAWSCLFGGLMLAAILITGFVWPESSRLARYDFLLLYALTVQLAFIATRLERPQEALVILVFHVVGTAMEVFKTHVGSWTYPEPSVLRLGAVPLFSGFMYAAVGSYFARVDRTFDFRFDAYPRRRWTVLLAALAYANFFTHHYAADIRWGLFLGAAFLFRRTVVSYRVWRRRHRMPLLLGFLLVALFIWLAENLATFAGVWLYPDQSDSWRPVSPAKMGSWFLLMLISWVLVTLIRPPKARASR